MPSESKIMKIDGRAIQIVDDDDIETVVVDPDNLESFANWTPTAGPRFTRLEEAQIRSYEKYSSDPKMVMENWRRETQRVASRCINPAVARGRRLSTRQLIVGRVQSGKTTNFTGVMALLADNGYRFFIVIGGTTKPLLQQTKDRLRRDLGDRWFRFFSTLDEHSTWKETEQQIVENLKDLALAADNPNRPTPQRAICLTVLKWNEGHLNAVETLLSQLANSPILERVPVVVIDDECDTFTPNSNIRNPDDDATAIYQAVAGVIEQLPVCTYLGYTATPMANELQELDDALKPQKVTLLEPGPDYLGPENLFDSESLYTELITDWDSQDPLPESLKEAVGTFVSHSLLFHHDDVAIRSLFLDSPALENGFYGPTSMLVHVARETGSTGATYRALADLVANWKEQLSAPPSRSGTLDTQTTVLLNRYLFPPLVRLGARDLIPTHQLVQLASEALRDMGVKLILGSSNDSAVEFPPESELARHPTWLFVGAQLLDRGQTLPNLLVTYLARSSGGGAKAGEAGGNVDTLLQRGRFFGYRRQYQKLLRGYFSETSLESLKATIRFEDSMRKKLKLADDNNENFGFVTTIYEMDPGSRKITPTRKSVTPRSLRAKNFEPNEWSLRHHRYGVEESLANMKLVETSITAWLGESNFEPGGQDLVLSLNPTDAADFLEKWQHHYLDKEKFEYVRKVLRFGVDSQKFTETDFIWRQSTDATDGRWERTYTHLRSDFYPNDSGNLSGPDLKMRTVGKPTFLLKIFRLSDRAGEVLLEPVPAISVNLGAHARFLIGMDQ
jgi:hypothetical protein